MSSSDNLDRSDAARGTVSQRTGEQAPAGEPDGSATGPRRGGVWPALLSIFVAGLVLGGTIMATVGRPLLPSTGSPATSAAAPSSSGQASPPPLNCSALIADGKRTAALLSQAGTDVHDLNTTGLAQVLSSAQKLQQQLDKDLRTCQSSVTSG